MASTNYTIKYYFKKNIQTCVFFEIRLLFKSINLDPEEKSGWTEDLEDLRSRRT